MRGAILAEMDVAVLNEVQNRKDDLRAQKDDLRHESYVLRDMLLKEIRSTQDCATEDLEDESHRMAQAINQHTINVRTRPSLQFQGTDRSANGRRREAAAALAAAAADDDDDDEHHD